MSFILFFAAYIVNPINSAEEVNMVRRADPEDLKLSKRNFIISDFSREEVNRNEKDKKGVMTLCFKKVDYNFDHAALVFEYFCPKSPNEITLMMVHYGRNDECCCGNSSKIGVWIEDETETLKKVYRAIVCPPSNPKDSKYESASYQRYACWILDNDALLEGLSEAQKSYKGTCVKYVSNIMRKVGLHGVDFGWWPETSSNLKALVDGGYITRPDKVNKQFKNP